MKKYFNSQYGVVKSWVENNQEEGYCRSNINYQDGTIYSYGYWPMAKIVSGIEHDKVVLFNDDRYSVTTAKHQCLVQWIASQKYSYTFNVIDLDGDHDINIKHYLSKLKDTIRRFDTTRFSGRSIISWNHIVHDELIQYCKEFRLKMPITLGLYLDENYSHIKNRFYKRTQGTGELFLPKWLAKKGMKNVESKDILRTRNAEIRREIISILGIERICYDLKAKIIDRQGNYELILLDLRDSRTRPFLKMNNPSVPEIWHVEGVHPCIKTVQDALNYRYYGNEMLYLPKYEKDEGLTWWDNRIRESEYRNNPANMRIKPEYQTTPLFVNPKNWNPEKLT